MKGIVLLSMWFIQMIEIFATILYAAGTIIFAVILVILILRSYKKQKALSDKESE